MTGGKNNLVSDVQEWFETHALSEDFHNEYIRKTSSRGEAISAKKFLEATGFGSRYDFVVKIVPYQEEEECFQRYQVHVSLDARY